MITQQDIDIHTAKCSARSVSVADPETSATDPFPLGTVALVANVYYVGPALHGAGCVDTADNLHRRKLGVAWGPYLGSTRRESLGYQNALAYGSRSRVGLLVGATSSYCN